MSLSVVLLGAWAFVLVGSRLSARQTFRGTLQDLVPRANDLARWTVEYRPVAETAEMGKAVGEILNFDDAVYAIYTSPEMRVSLYAAYWSPGKMSHRLIGGHTPDVCWVGGGWVKRKADNVRLRAEAGARKREGRDQTAEAGGQHGEANSKERRREGNTGVFPMEYREYELGGQTEYVVFCHIVGGRSMSYGTGGVPPWYGFLGDLWARGFRQREEQFFVRISSNRPLPEFQAAPSVRIFLQRLALELDKTRRASGAGADDRK